MKGYTLLPYIASIQTVEYWNKHNDSFPLVNKEAFGYETEIREGFKFQKAKFDFYVDQFNKKCSNGGTDNICKTTENLLDSGAKILLVTRIASETKDLGSSTKFGFSKAKDSIRSNYSLLLTDLQKVPDPVQSDGFKYNMNQFTQLQLSTQQVDSTNSGKSDSLCILSAIGGGKLNCPQPEVSRKITTKYDIAGLKNLINNIAHCK